MKENIDQDESVMFVEMCSRGNPKSENINKKRCSPFFGFQSNILSFRCVKENTNLKLMTFFLVITCLLQLDPYKSMRLLVFVEVVIFYGWKCFDNILSNTSFLLVNKFWFKPWPCKRMV